MSKQDQDKGFVPLTPSQVQEVQRFMAQATGRMLEEGITLRDLTCLNENTPEFVDGLRGLFREHAVERFTYEETYEVRADYPAAYQGPKPLDEQFAMLRKDFPHLRSYDVGAPGRTRKDDRAEGGFLVPAWSEMAGNYQEAAGIALIEVCHRFGGDYAKFIERWPELREGGRKKAFFRRLRKEQPGHDTLYVHGQLGRLWRACSAQRAVALMDVFDRVTEQTPIGVYEFAMILLTHSERIQSSTDLYALCPGDRAIRDGVAYCPVFSSLGDAMPILCGTMPMYWVHHPGGVASFFQPRDIGPDADD